MNHFVIIFRQGPQGLTDSDRQSLREATTPWAQRMNESGHQLEPRILGPERQSLGAEDPAADGAWPITALLFVAAEDLKEAAALAESHPAMKYPFRVEVRPWGVPVPAAPPQQGA